MWREHGWYGDRRANGIEQLAVLQPHFFAPQHVGGDDGQRNGEFFNTVRTDERLQRLHEHLAFEQASAAPGDVEKAQDVELGELLHPVGVVVELAGGVEAADQCADRAAGNGADLPAFAFEHTDHADMCESAGAAAP